MLMMMIEYSCKTCHYLNIVFKELNSDCDLSDKMLTWSRLCFPSTLHHLSIGSVSTSTLGRLEN